MDAEDDAENCIKIFVRVRPPLKDIDNNPAKCLDVTSNSSISLMCQSNPKQFNFDHVADETTSQETVFGCVGRRTVDACMKGYNGTIFAYGQTGSGKTYTMLGPGEDNCENFCHELRGVIPRCLEYLFHLIQAQYDLHGDNFESVCKCSFFEIYKEHCYDLLNCMSTRPLSLRECTNRGVFVENAKEVRVTTASAAYQVLSDGWKNRRVASTSMNRESSRSHAVFTIAVELKEQTADGVMKVRRSLLNLVDLAGSERQTDAQTSGLRLQEASSINRSLSVLGNVMMALVDAAQTNNKTRHIPYRNSKLTFLLRDSLGGNAKTFIIANVHPNSKFFGESLSTLQFMKRAKLIKNNAVVNEDMQGSILLLQAEIRKLRHKLSESIHRPAIGISSNGERDNFFLAMEMFQRKCEEVERFKEMMKKHNNFFLGGKMVNKLRQAEISSLKEALASKSLLPASESFDQMEEQINKLQYQVDNHPMVTSQCKRISELEHEVRRLQSLETVKRQLKLQEEKERSLEELFCESRTNNNNKPSDSECSKQNSILLQRVKALEDELIKKEKENVELRDAKDNFEVELRGKKQQVEELNKVLEASQTSANIYLKQMNDIHEMKIRTITTPLRRRSIMSGGGDTDDSTPAKQQKLHAISFSDDIFNGSVENILDTPMPFDLEQETALEEAEKLRHDSEQIAQRQQTQEKEIVRLKSEVDMLAQKLQLAQQNISKERNQNTDIVKDREDLKNEYEIKRLEARDLKFELKYADKEHEKIKQKLEEVQRQLEKDASIYHEKYILLETKHQETETAKEESKQLCLMLESDLEVARGEAAFLKEQLAERQKDLNDRMKKINDLQRENREVLIKLDELMDKQNSEEYNLRKILHLETNVNDIKKEKMNLVIEIDCLNEDMKTMNQRQQEDKTAINLLMKQLAELRASNSMHEIASEALRTNILEKDIELETADKVIRKHLEDMCRHQNKVKQLETEIERLEDKHKFKLENLQDDLDSWSDQYEDLMINTKTLQAKNDDLEINIEKLQEQIKKMENALEEMKKNENKNVNLVSTTEEGLRELKVQRENYEGLCQQFEDVMVQYRQSQQRISQLENVNDALQEKSNLQADQTQTLKAENSDKLSHYLQSIEDLQKQINEHQSSRNQLQEDLQNIKQELAKAHQEEMNLNNQIEKLTHLEESCSENVQNYKSQALQANANNEQLQKENLVLAEECQKLKEEAAKLAGHTNHLQKIHYLKRVKEENYNLKMERTELEEFCSKLETRLRTHEPNFRLRKHRKEACGDSTNQT